MQNYIDEPKSKKTKAKENLPALSPEVLGQVWKAIAQDTVPTTAVPVYSVPVNYPSPGQIHGYPEEPREIVPINPDERSMYDSVPYVPRPNAPQYYLPGGLGVAERAAPIVGPNGMITRQAVSTTPQQLDLPVRESDLDAYRRMIHNALYQKYK